MSNLTLPRMLSGRRNVYDSEREEFEKAQSSAVSKAINSQEIPLKEKHVRTLILGTHREKGAGTFWSFCTKLALESNPITTWKFVHVLHKLMREGHPHVLSDSQKYHSKLIHLGEYWVARGPLISCYCKLVLAKMDFHQKNQQLPGNMVLSDNKLASLGENDYNNWYCLVLDMMDYMDEILALQTAVFASLDASRSNSMTKVGQCRLAPLILCILDASCLYDYMVKMLFKLHAKIPPDTLFDHRNRFHKQFKPLGQFFYASSNLQYFKYLISVPNLPDNPPNFLSQSAFLDYVPVQARLLGDDGGSDLGGDTPPDSNSLAGDTNLVDVSEPIHGAESARFDDFFGSNSDTGSFGQTNGTHEKDQIINSLQHDCDDSKATIQKLMGQLQAMQDQYRLNKSQYDQNVQNRDHTIRNLSMEVERHRTKLEQVDNEQNQLTIVKVDDAERKAQSSDEKFRKMKEVYAKLREEHIEMLKKFKTTHDEMDAARKENMETTAARMVLESELTSYRQQLSLHNEQIQQSSSEAAQSTANYQQLEQELNDFKSKIDIMSASHDIELSTVRDQFDQVSSSLVQVQQQLQHREDSLWVILSTCTGDCAYAVRETLAEFDNPAHLGVTCSPEFMLSRIPLFAEWLLTKIKPAFVKAHELRTVTPDLVGSICVYSHLACAIILNGKATANAAPVEHIEILTSECRHTASDMEALLGAIGDPKLWELEVIKRIGVMQDRTDSLDSKFRALLGKMGDVKADELGSMMDKEMKQMDIAIQQAAVKLQEMLAQRKQTDTGIKLEVNEKILDSCNSLMMAVLELVKKSRDLQSEIVGQGRGAGSANDFYVRNHQWTEGLLTAAKAIGVGAGVLMESADRVVNGTGKFDELVVASREIAASTAQLVIASRVKADRDSVRLSKMTGASKIVTSATATVVATVKSGQETLQDQVVFDFSSLSLHQSKRLEMEAKVRVLELEDLLQKERLKLSELKKKHYEMAGPAEGWEVVENETS